MQTSSSSRGQVLVLVASGLVILLAIAALVVDLGLSWMLRRHEQNAADSGALAAARWIMDYRATSDPTYGPQGPGSGTVGLMWQEACGAAREDGFFSGATDNLGCIPANDTAQSQLQVFYPPQGSQSGDFSGNQCCVQVEITSSHASFFGRILGQSQAFVSTSAVAANDTGGSNPYSLIALDPNADCSSGKIGGNNSSNLKVTIAGGIQVNSTCGSGTYDGQCSISGSGALQMNGGAQVSAAQGVSVTGTCKGPTGSITGTLTEGATQLGDPLGELSPPNLANYSTGTCDGAPATSQCSFSSGTHTVTPGIFYGGWKITGPSTSLTLAPGTYIIAGGGITQNNGSIVSVDDAGNPAHVMIYSTDDPNYAAACHAGWSASAHCQQGLNLTGGTLNLTGLASGKYKGMLIWMDGGGSCPTLKQQCAIQLGGSTSLSLAGTIYAPRELVQLDGGSSGTGTATVQIISWQWTIIGNSVLDLPYDQNDLYHLNQRGLVH